MIIKSNEQAYEMVILLFVVSGGFWIVHYIFANEPWNEEDVLFQLGLTALLLIPIYYWIRDCKKIVMDAESCTIFLGPFKKKYQWDDIQTKKIETYKGWNAYVKNYAKGAFFSTKSQKHLSIKHCVFLNPLASFYVFFEETQIRSYRIRKGTKISIPEYYSVKENDFYRQLENWGVELEKLGADAVNLDALRKQLKIQPFSIKDSEE